MRIDWYCDIEPLYSACRENDRRGGDHRYEQGTAHFVRVFDYLRILAIEPYTKLSDIAREQLGDGVRLVSLFPGESFSTYKPGLRVTVLSGKVRLEPTGLDLDLTSTRDRTIHTQDSENRLIAGENSVVLPADSEFLDTLSSWVELAAYAKQSGGDELLKRLLAVKHTLAFKRLPLEHVIQALQQMVPRKVKAGEVIVTQGERGDAFYLIWSGRAEAWQTDIYDEEQKLVNSLGPGDAFGDEALVTGGTRNATVRMVEDGELLVLGEQAFRDLMSRPLIEEIPPTACATCWTASGKRSMSATRKSSRTATSRARSICRCPSCASAQTKSSTRPANTSRYA
jgi:CRP-like cAMP-binding protein